MRRWSSTTPGTNPKDFQRRQRADRIISKLPKFFGNYAIALKNKPLSHVVSFLMGIHYVKMQLGSNTKIAQCTS